MIELLIGLSTPQTRADTARALARQLGVDELLLFVCDPQLGAMLPAAGTTQTLRGGDSWWQFMRQVGRADGLHRGQVEMPPGSWRAASACAVSKVAVVVLGGDPGADQLAELHSVLPWLEPTLVNEQRVRLAAVELQQANELAQRSVALSHALETARSEAARLNVELREEERLKDQFLAMLAHELRNPLAGVVASLHVLRRSADDAGLAHRALALMDRQTSQLQKLIDDLMDVARVSHGRIDLDLRPLALQDVLREAVDSNRHALDAKGHLASVQAPDGPLVVNGDPVRLTQVFSNLLHNAIKYTDPGGRIAIDVRQEGANAVVAIADSGIGIEPVMLESVFKLFQQAPVALDRSQGGLGLGLTLVRKLLTLHGGRITAHSAGPGLGSTFTVCLPLHAGPLTASTQQTAASPTASGDTLHVLLVEDNADVAEALSELLQLYGHTVSTASRGRDGLALVERGGIDLVLLDLGLPDMDGYTVVRRIRAAGHTALPVIALTGYGGSDVGKSARDAGFDDHRVKPLGGGELDEVLAAALRAQAVRRQATSHTGPV